MEYAFLYLIHSYVHSVMTCSDPEALASITCLKKCAVKTRSDFVIHKLPVGILLGTIMAMSSLQK